MVINPSDLVFIHGTKRGCLLYFEISEGYFHAKQIQVADKLLNFVRQLKDAGFESCHRNYLINLNFKPYYELDGNVIQFKNINIPVSRRNRRKIKALLS